MATYVANWTTYCTTRFGWWASLLTVIPARSAGILSASRIAASALPGSIPGIVGSSASAASTAEPATSELHTMGCPLPSIQRIFARFALRTACPLVPFLMASKATPSSPFLLEDDDVAGDRDRDSREREQVPCERLEGGGDRSEERRVGKEWRCRA